MRVPRALLVVAAVAVVLVLPGTAWAGWVQVGTDLEPPSNTGLHHSVSLTALGTVPVAAWVSDPHDNNGSNPPTARVALLQGSTWVSAPTPRTASNLRTEELDIATAGGTVYVAITEMPNPFAAPYPLLRVRRFDFGTQTWQTVGGTLNVDTTGNSYLRRPDIVAGPGGQPCVGWYETPVNEPDRPGGRAYVKCFNGVAWTLAGGGPVNGTATARASGPSLATVAGVLHAAYTEVDAGEMNRVPGEEAGGAIHVRRLVNGTWGSVGTPRRVEAEDFANLPSLAGVEGTPILAWQELDKTPDTSPGNPNPAALRIYAQRFDGANWVPFAGSSVVPLSFLDRNATRPKLAAVGGVPHVAYTENADVRVRKLAQGGSFWEPVEGGVPIKKQEEGAASATSLVEIDGRPHVGVVGSVTLYVKRWELTVRNEGAKPSISGVPQTGQTLTCNAGDWTGNPHTYFYMWERGARDALEDDAVAWEPVTVLESANTYTVQEQDEGMRIRCRVRARNDHDEAEATSPSKRTDAGPPLNSVAPTVQGSAISRTPHTCTPGVWDSEADFAYRWLRDGKPIPGETAATFTPPRLREPGTSNGGFYDEEKRISCEVSATNDIGTSGFARSRVRLIVDDVPYNIEAPEASWVEEGPNPIGRVARCTSPGHWLDDYVRLGEPGYTYEYEWFRGDAPIPGATSDTYTTTVEDIGQLIQCRIVTSNPAGRGRPAGANQLLVRLPQVTDRGQLLTVAGENEFVPINMLAVGRGYRDVLDEYVLGQLTAARDAETQQCRQKYPSLAPVPQSQEVLMPVSAAMRCRLLVYEAPRVHVLKQGVVARCRDFIPNDPFNTRKARLVRAPLAGRLQWCLNLGFAVPPVDPTKPPALDVGLQERLAANTPAYVIWDLNNDGIAEVTCPGTGPVLRSMWNRGTVDVRAVIVFPDSATSGVYSEATALVSNPAGRSDLPRAAFRNPQPFMCRTSMEQPPAPQTGPCITDGTIGRVHVTGNFCPIHIRTMSQTQIEEIRLNNSELLPVLFDFAAKAEREENEANPRVYATRQANPFLLPPANARVNPGTPAGRAATLQNYASSLPAFSAPSQVATQAEANRFAMSPATANARIKNLLAGLPQLKKSEAANFALDQMYISHGGFKINGVSVAPPDAGNLPGLIIPTDVQNALTRGSVPDMKVLMKEAKTQLDTLVLSERKRLEASFKDSAQEAAAGLLQSDFIDRFKNLKVGPFDIGGHVDVKLNKNETATVTAKASLPYLKAPASTPLTSTIVFTGDRSGKLVLNTVEFAQKEASFKAVKLQDLLVRYTGALEIQGKLKIGGAGIGLHRFLLSDQGRLQALDVEFVAPPGTGVSLAPGVFLTALRGGYDDPASKLIAGATVSVGPKVTEDCSMLGIDGVVELSWLDILRLHSRADIIVACIPLAKVTLDADETGYIKVVATMSFSAGPLFVEGGIGGQFDAPTERFQLELRARGGFRDIPIVGTVSVGVQGVLSNKGMAACGKIDVLWEEISAGAGVEFVGGVPPLTLPQLIAGLRVFTGCDLGGWRVLPSVVRRRATAAQAAGGRPFDVAGGARGMALGFQGADTGAPRVRLRSPSGKVYDFTDAAEGKLIDDELWGTIIEEENRTVVLLKKPEQGRWSVELGEGSPPLARIEGSDVLPKPEVKGTIRGSGSSKVLRYDVRRIPGQEVRLIEAANGAHRQLRVVKGGGRGKIRFRPAEADAPRRTIVAEVSQDGLPRDNIDVVRFSAPNPRVGTPRRVRVRRTGRRAVVTWRRASLAARYEVLVRAGDGGVELYERSGKRLRVTVPGVSRGEGLIVTVTPVSERGRRGKAGRARLKGTMKLGAAKPERARRVRGKRRRGGRGGRRS